MEAKRAGSAVPWRSDQHLGHFCAHEPTTWTTGVWIQTKAICPPESRLSQNAFLVGSEVWSKIEIGVCLVFLIAESFVPPCIVPVGLFSGRNLFSKRFSCFSQNVSFSSFPCGQLSALQECDPNYPPIRPCFRSPQHFLYQGSCQVQNLCKLYVNEKTPKGINERFNVQMQFKCHYTPKYGWYSSNYLFPPISGMIKPDLLDLWDPCFSTISYFNKNVWLADV